MLHHIPQFIEYCQLANFSDRSIQALESRLNEFSAFLKQRQIKSFKHVGYLHLIEFAGDFQAPSVHVRKSRIWTLRQFYHFLTLNGYVAENIALQLAYPKIEKTVPHFLTQDEYQRMVHHFCRKAKDLAGLRDLAIILLLGTLGLRTGTLCALDICDVDVQCGLLWVQEKGRRRRNLVLPRTLCKIMDQYLRLCGRKTGPLLLSKRKRRISQRTLQDLFRSAADELGIHKKLHALLFRHSAATHLNRVSDIEITQQVLGHAWRSNTNKYTHLNPDQYAVYMKQHPYMRKEAPCSP